MFNDERSWQKLFIATHLVAIVMLIIAVFNNPYGYYILLRWVLATIFGFNAFYYFKNESLAGFFSFVLGAIIYNPLIPLHLNKEIWTVVNLITAALLAVSLAMLVIKKLRVSATDN
jgi:ABC-type uncharacterized transport system permease subunit